MSSPAGALVRGAIAGGLATWVMDLVTERMQQAQRPADARKEQAAQPGGQPPAENLVDKAAAAAGVQPNEELRSVAIPVAHYALGILPGAAYALLRRRLPLLGAGHGVVYGLLLWAVNDEWLNTALGLAGPPGAYPMSSHARGLVGHLALGVATDVGIDLLGSA